MTVSNLTGNMVPGGGGGASSNLIIESYGSISAQGNSTAETTVDATFRKIVAWNTNDLANNVVPDHATGNDLTHPVAGVYLVMASISFSGSASKTYEIALFKSGVTTGFILERKLGAGGDVGRATLMGVVEMSATDTLELYQRTTDGGSIMTVTEGVLVSTSVSTIVPGGSLGGVALGGGYGFYLDDNFTAGTGQSVATHATNFVDFVVNGDGATREVNPQDLVVPMFDVLTSEVLPIKLDDVVTVRVQFTAANYSGAAPYIVVHMDAGGASGAFISQTIPLLKAGDDQLVLFEFTAFAGIDWMENGGLIQVRYDGSGSVDLFNKAVQIQRTFSV